jgi:zinc protease
LTFEAFGNLARMLHPDALSDAQVETSRKNLRTWAESRRGQVEVELERILRRQLYPRAHPYHFALEGGPAAVDAVSRSEVERFFREHLQPDQFVAIAAGDVAIESFVDSLNFAFSSWKGTAVTRKALPEPVAAPLDGPAITLLDRPNRGDAAIAMAARGAAWSSPDYLPLFTLHGLLGSVARGRLWISLRERSGDTYVPRSNFGAARGSWPFETFALTDIDNAAAVISTTAAELSKLTGAPLESFELERLKASAIHRIPVLFSTLDSTIEAVGNLAAFDRPADSYRNMRRELSLLRADDLVRVARTFLAPDKLRWAVAGPADRLKEPLERLGLGEVRVVREP